MPATNTTHTCGACDMTRPTIEAGPCGVCGHCEACCRCRAPRSQYEAAQRVRHTRNVPLRFHGAANARFPRHVGVEIECLIGSFRGGAIRAALDAWGATATTDGSIRSADGSAANNGVEIVTAPARGEAAIQQIADITAALARQNASVNKSCGCHVHVDARGATYGDLWRLCALLPKIERGLFNLTAPSRAKKPPRGTWYCEPWGKRFEAAGLYDAASLTERERAIDVATYGSESAARCAKADKEKYHHARYRSVNFHAFTLQQTIEFRLGAGSVDRTKITMWASLCAKIVDFAFKATDERILALRGTPAEVIDLVIADDPDLRAWVKARRAHFALKRSRTGLPPRRAERPAPPPPLPVVGPGPSERSEV